MRRISCTCLVLLVCLSVGSFADNVHPNEDSKVEGMARIEDTKPIEGDKEQQHQYQHQQEKENPSMNSEEKEDDVLSESNAGEGETNPKEDIPSNLKTRSFDLSASMSSMENDGLMDRGMFGFGRGRRRRGMGMGMGGLGMGMGMGGMYPGLGRSPYGGMGSRYGMGRMMGGGRYGMDRMMGGYGGMSPYGDPSMMGGMGMNGMGGMGMGGMRGMGMMPGMM